MSHKTGRQKEQKQEDREKTCWSVSGTKMRDWLAMLAPKCKHYPVSPDVFISADRKIYHHQLWLASFLWFGLSFFFSLVSLFLVWFFFWGGGRSHIQSD